MMCLTCVTSRAVPAIISHVRTYCSTYASLYIVVVVSLHDHTQVRTSILLLPIVSIMTPCM